MGYFFLLEPGHFVWSGFFLCLAGIESTGGACHSIWGLSGVDPGEPPADDLGTSLAAIKRDHRADLELRELGIELAIVIAVAVAVLVEGVKCPRRACDGGEADHHYGQQRERGHDALRNRYRRNGLP